MKVKAIRRWFELFFFSSSPLSSMPACLLTWMVVILMLRRKCLQWWCKWSQSPSWHFSLIYKLPRLANHRRSSSLATSIKIASRAAHFKSNSFYELEFDQIARFLCIFISLLLLVRCCLLARWNDTKISLEMIYDCVSRTMTESFRTSPWSAHCE